MADVGGRIPPASARAHQLDAVYNHMLRLPRIRFLLADDPGAGKTIMAGLLMRELMQRGGVKRVLVLCPKPESTEGM